MRFETHYETFSRQRRLVHDYARSLRFAAGFPAGIEDDRLKMVFLRSDAVEWRDLPWADLGFVPLNDAGARYRRTHDYARREGYDGAYPNFHQADYGNGVVLGTIFIKPGVARYQDVLKQRLELITNISVSELNWGWRFLATHKYANWADFEGGYPNFHQAYNGPEIGIVYGTLFLRGPLIEVYSFRREELPEALTNYPWKSGP